MTNSPQTRTNISIALTGKPGHAQSPETRAKISIAEWKCGRQTSNRKCQAKRRVLGFISLNSSFNGCEGHHINKEFVIYIPKELHRSISHNVFTGKNMDKINVLAYEWLERRRIEMVKQTDSVETIVAMVALLQGRPQIEVLEQLYEAGQQSVVADPQAWGLIGGRA